VSHHNLRLVGYIRTGDTHVTADEQRKMITDHCEKYGHHLVGFTHVDMEKPQYGLQEAMAALQEDDGIIAMDLDRFVRHPEDRLLDLRPLIQQFMHSGKVLVTVKEGIETRSAAGQQRVNDFLSEWFDRDNVTMHATSDRATHQ
jgi:hypothetical protein